MEPIILSRKDLDLFRTAISAYDSSISSLSEETYKRLAKDCDRMDYIIDSIQQGHCAQYKDK